MKILQINSVCGIGSTGRIATDIYSTLVAEGHDCMIAYGRSVSENISEKDTMKIGSTLGVLCHTFLSRCTDKSGFYSNLATKKIIKEIKKYSPDVIHLHNIHGYYINIKLLFDYLNNSNTPVIWTLHDCWAFTGHCAYFDYINCYKWKETCRSCPQKNKYPKSLVMDNSKNNYRIKSSLFNQLTNLTIVTPSKWLEDKVNQSFLSKHNMLVIPNGIDLTNFSFKKGDFRDKYNLLDKYLILGVANVWDDRKGFKDFIKLSDKIPLNFKIILVGLPRKMIKYLPTNVLGIEKTSNVNELAEIYSTCDVFVNCTYEDNFPTTNLESLACGTPVITYNTGGSIESIDSTCGLIVKQGNIDELMISIEVIKQKKIDKETCIKRAKLYDKNIVINKYINIYKQLEGKYHGA